MAENEQLDASKARKWRSVARATAAESDPETIAAEVERVHCQAIRAVKKDGDLAGMFRAIDDPQQLARLLPEWKGDPLVTEWIGEAAESVGSLEQRIEMVLDLMLGNCLSDVPTLAASCDPPISISTARDRLNAAMAVYRSGIIRHMAAKFAADPDWKPKARARKKGSALPSFGSTEQMLSESLLKVPR